MNLKTHILHIILKYTLNVKIKKELGINFRFNTYRINHVSIEIQTTRQLLKIDL